ncbi:MAG: shikimate kinase [Flavobacteriales bacterium]|nr:shikimate kinase [Flavobacteriales bacterium]
MRIFLVGYMAAGKTSVGKRLSTSLGMAFEDLDSYIEATEECTINDIFKREGEAGFRGIERRCLRQLIETQDQVIVATGGGTPCFYDNLAYMKECGLVVYLKHDVSSLVFRLRNDSAARPLIAELSEQELEHFVHHHLEERREYYEDADLIINAMGMSDRKIENLADEIARYSR